MIYEEMPPISRKELTEAVQSNSVEKICSAIIRLSLNEADSIFTLQKCEDLLQINDAWVLRAIATALAHTARIHGVVQQPLLKKVRSHPQYLHAKNAVDVQLLDVEHWLGKKSTE